MGKLFFHSRFSFFQFRVHFGCLPDNLGLNFMWRIEIFMMSKKSRSHERLRDLGKFQMNKTKLQSFLETFTTNSPEAAFHHFELSVTFTHLLKCVFLLRLSSIFGCNFPICSSSFDNVFVRFFFSFFWAWSLSCLLWRRLLKNIETLRSSTVPLVMPWLSMVSCCCFFPSSFDCLFCPALNWNLRLPWKGKHFVREKKLQSAKRKGEKFFHFSFLFFCC